MAPFLIPVPSKSDALSWSTFQAFDDGKSEWTCDKTSNENKVRKIRRPRKRARKIIFSTASSSVEQSVTVKNKEADSSADSSELFKEFVDDNDASKSSDSSVSELEDGYKNESSGCGKTGINEIFTNERGKVLPVEMAKQQIANRKSSVKEDTTQVRHLENGTTVVMGVHIKKKEKEPTVSTNDLYIGDSDNELTDEQFLFKPSKANDCQHHKSNSTTSLMPVNRHPDVQLSRMRLPILSQEAEILEAINANDVIIICGETGSGKTTQVPQFLYEYGFCKDGLCIGVTEPRRVATISTARRVAEELNLPQTVVSYQIRYDSQFTENTRIKFMTDGILLREISSDFLLSKYSAIVIDEAHERNLNTDILIGLLSRIVPLRRRHYHRVHYETASQSSCPVVSALLPLKLIIMSATLRVSDFTQNVRLFSSSPSVLNVEARQFPVSIHFNRITYGANYLDMAFRRIVKMHAKLPPGGILVFLTGRNDIEAMIRKLSEIFNSKRNEQESAAIANTAEENILSTNPNSELQFEIEDMNDRLDDGDSSLDAGVSDGFTTSSADSEELEFLARKSNMKARVLPLYSAMPTHMQLEIFKPPPAGERLIVVSTNVAETSLTIPGIRYVLDTGREKVKVYDKATGTSQFRVNWICKASAEQRAGRAGRSGPGHCYRLYSSALYNDTFEQFSEPEILKVPIDSTVLQMKSMHIDDIERFPFPTPPDADSVTNALRSLQMLQAIDSQGRITPLGATLSIFPLLPRYAKMLVLGHQGNCLSYVLNIVASSSIDELWDAPHAIDFIDSDLTENEECKRRNREKRKLWNASKARWTSRDGDAFTALRVLGGLEYACASHDRNLEISFNPKIADFCRQNCLRLKAVEEALKLKQQLSQSVCDALTEISQTNADSVITKESISCSLMHRCSTPPSETQLLVLKQIIASGFIDHVARRLPANRQQAILEQMNDHQEWSPNILKAAYEVLSTEEPVFIHPHSAVFDPEYQPEYLVYGELLRSAKGKLYMRNCTPIEPSWLGQLGPMLCTVSKPLQQPPPQYSASEDCIYCFVKITFGPRNWQLPLQRMHFPFDVPHIWRYVARAIMDGSMFPEFKPLLPFWTLRPSSLADAPLSSKKLFALVTLLQQKHIVSRQSLLKQWEQNPHFLLPELQGLLQPFKHENLRALWPGRQRKNVYL